MATADDVRALALKLPRSYQVEVRGVEKFRVGPIDRLSFSADDTIAGIAFPKEERDGVIAAEPEKFLNPRGSDLRYNWIHVQLAAVPDDEMR
ncbi:MAG: MmcQ/YjbR family DNA-binding protein, partial [Trebonia sp.]